MKGVTSYHITTIVLSLATIIVVKGFYEDYMSKQVLEKKSRDMVIASTLSIKKIDLDSKVAEKEAATERKSFKHISVPNFKYSKNENYSNLRGEDLIKINWMNEYYNKNGRKLLKIYEDRQPAKCIGVFTSKEEQPPKFFMIWNKEKIKNSTMTIADYAKLKCRE